jgi:hypothetical protein
VKLCREIIHRFDIDCDHCEPIIKRVARFRAEARTETIKRACPGCSTGMPGVDALCDRCWKEFLGTHVGGR